MRAYFYALSVGVNNVTFRIKFCGTVGKRKKRNVQVRFYRAEIVMQTTRGAIATFTLVDLLYRSPE